MRFCYIAAVVPLALAASALAVLPASAGIAGSGHLVSGRATAGHPAGRMTPGVSSPLAYSYEGRASGKRAGSSYLFSCQEPGAPLNCYTPQEVATAYDVPRTLTGAGQTIVIVDAFGDPTIAQDLNVEDTTFGLPAASLKILYPNGQPAFNPASADEVDWSGEIALDVESAHAIAPAAPIDLVIAKSDQDPDILSALNYAVGHHLGSVLSQSFGEAEACEAPNTTLAEHLLYVAAEAENMSVFASSGDDGAAQPSCDGTTYVKSAALPAADPLVTSVGGTSLAASQPTGRYLTETAWNDAFGASGGGYSRVYSTPLYQLGSAQQPGRGVPDVSYSGDVNSGLLIAWSQGNLSQVGSIFLFGGTSAGSPQWAAITALADQAAHRALGFLNSRLYATAHSALYPYVFHDISTGSNSVTFTAGNGSAVTVPGYQAARGWDPVTGLGTPDVAHLIQVIG